VRRLAAIGAALAALAAAAPAAAFDAPIVRASDRAAHAYRVPSDLLLAIAYASTHWQMPASEDGAHGAHAWGPMHLVARGPGLRLARAERLTGLPRERLQTDLRANLLGGAAVLAASEGPASLPDWHERLRRVGGRLWADDVFRVLAAGTRARVRGRLVVLRAHRELARVAPHTRDYGVAMWRPSPNYTTAARTYRRAVDHVVIHTTEGSFAGSVQWLGSSAADASAHYVVSRAGQIAELVRERNIAWHAGNWNVNSRSIGVEHEGFTWRPGWYTETEYRASARLVARICVRYGVPIGRRHIIGHNEVPDPNHPGQWGGVSHHRDPGPYWNWPHYMALVRAYAATSSVTPRPPAGVDMSGFAPGDELRGTVTWQAVPTLIRPSEIQRVSFWIDGVRRTIEYYAPYLFDGDGLLDTTDLSDGSHRLRVRLVTRLGRVLRRSALVTVANHVPAVACPDGEYSAAYYLDSAGRHLTDAPVISGCESGPLAYAWGAGGPGGLATDHFSARWLGRFAFDAGSYTFSVTGDDGVRLYVDGVRAVDAWRNEPVTTYQATLPLEAGTHTVELEYFEDTGSASAELAWAPAG
jgi:N-acetyl-anhydromuramyl-L-alanine amidase AmpD